MVATAPTIAQRPVLKPPWTIVLDRPKESRVLHDLRTQSGRQKLLGNYLIIGNDHGDDRPASFHLIKNQRGLLWINIKIDSIKAQLRHGQNRNKRFTQILNMSPQQLSLTLPNSENRT